ncbi:VWA domain-containing protein [Luminiphilus syltensis]|nr:VWA domain-containing protein [Luminiphilus syltensis]
MTASFHFIRPEWLALAPVLMTLWWLVRQRIRERRQAATVVAPHLQSALTVDQGSSQRWFLIDHLTLLALCLVFATAGPTWSQQNSPWFEETAPMVIAIEVSDSMRSNDLLPTRLDRARFKVMDLLALRAGAPTALIAYAGSAHIVMPPSKDIAVITPFLESLDPAIMPEPGTRADRVMPLATSILGAEAAAGTLLFINDGFEPLDIDALAEFAATPETPSMSALVLGSDEGGVALLPDGTAVTQVGGGLLDTRVDSTVLNRVTKAAGVQVVRSTVGDRDIQRILRASESNLRAAEDPDAQWKDQAWWLLWPALLLSLLLFRRGWTF